MVNRTLEYGQFGEFNPLTKGFVCFVKLDRRKSLSCVYAQQFEENRHRKKGKIMSEPHGMSGRLVSTFDSSDGISQVENNAFFWY